MIEDKGTEKVKDLAKKLGLIVNAGAGKPEGKRKDGKKDAAAPKGRQSQGR